MRLAITCICFCLYASLLGGHICSSSEYKYEVANNVFNNLIEAKGVKNVIRPKLTLSNSKTHVAWCSYDDALIGIEEGAYDVCVSFGKDSLNALAAILGHEIIHYYEKHGHDAFYINASNTNDGALKSHANDEYEADYLGGFLAAAAGYEPFNILPQFLDRIYLDYNLPHNLPGYPSLTERMQLAQKSMQKSKELHEVFVFANYLMAYGEYDAASIYYRYILKEFQSREVYNNLGVCNLSAALLLFDNMNSKVVYPFELDFTSRLRSSTKSGSSENKAVRRKSLLNEAMHSFETAIALDPDYATGYLNLANYFVITGQYEDAEFYIRKSINKAKGNSKSADQIVSNANILNAIMDIFNNKKTKAEKQLNKESQNGNMVAKVNLEIIQNGGNSVESTAITNTHRNKETIKNISLYKVAQDLERQRLETDKQTAINKEIVFAKKTYPMSTVYIHLNMEDLHYFILHTTKQANPSKVKLGARAEEVMEMYTAYNKVVPKNNGTILVYPKEQLLFNFNTTNILTEWGVALKK